MNQSNHTRFIVGCISGLSALAMALGFYLLLKGFQAGELLVTNGGVGGISGLIGFLGGKMAVDKPMPQGTADDPLKTQSTNTPENPVIVKETK